jgi:hypothetical protein
MYISSSALLLQAQVLGFILLLLYPLSNHTQTTNSRWRAWTSPRCAQEPRTRPTTSTTKRRRFSSTRTNFIEMRSNHDVYQDCGYRRDHAVEFHLIRIRTLLLQEPNA